MKKNDFWNEDTLLTHTQDLINLVQKRFFESEEVAERFKDSNCSKNAKNVNQIRTEQNFSHMNLHHHRTSRNFTNANFEQNHGELNYTKKNSAQNRALRNYTKKKIAESSLKKCFSEQISKKNSVQRNLEQNLSDKQISAVTNALVVLQRGLTGQRNLVGNSYMDKKNLIDAYILYYWQVSYMQMKNVLFSVQNRLVDILQNASTANKTLKILEIGSGPAPSSVALYDFCIDFCKKNNIVVSVEFILLDSSLDALNSAKKLIEQTAKSAKTSLPKITIINSNFEKDSLLLSKLQTDNIDVIIASHSLNELWNTEKDFIKKRYNFITSFAQKLSKNGLLFLIEPALLSTSRSLIALRDELVLNGYTVLAPCLKNAPCPALKVGEQHTCHAEFFGIVSNLVFELAKKSGLDRNSVKMTFFVFLSPSSPRSSQPLQATALLEKKTIKANSPSKVATPHLAPSIESSPPSSFSTQSSSPQSPLSPPSSQSPQPDTEHLAMPLQSTSVPNAPYIVTIVSDQMLNKSGRIRYLVCDGEKRFAFSAKKDDTNAKSQGFFALRRYDKITIKEPEIRGNNEALGFAENTKISLI